MKAFQIWIARGSVLSLSTIVAFASRFARTAILSRLLLPDEFGISVAITTVLSIATLVTDLSFDQFIIMNPGKNVPQALAAVHVLSIARGLLLSAMLVVIAPYMAEIFGVPQFTVSFALAAICPLISSFDHLSIKQIQNTFHYAPQAAAQTAAQLAALAAALAAGYFFRDHRAILASYFTESVVYTIASHLSARTAYRVWPDEPTLRIALRFGFPLLLNGIGLATMAQFDRTLVGSWLGVDALGNYAVILSLGLFPMTFFFRACGPLVTASLLSHNDTSSRNTHYTLLLFIAEIASVLYTLFVALTLDWLVPLIFGQSFHVSQGVHLLVVLIAFLRLLRGSVPTSFLLVAGRTRDLALVNLTSGIGLLGAFWLLHYWSSIEAILFGLLVGECLAVMLLFWMSSARVSQSRFPWRSDLIMSINSVAMIVGALAFNPEPTWKARAVVFFMGFIGVAAQLAVGIHNHKRLYGFPEG